jgi:pimeloyl-ACP methyl ester carboxylesterase
MAVTFRVPGVGLAYALLDGRGPVVVFCPGFASDMGGTKAMRLWAWCGALGVAMLRFDYSGHGASGGRFVDGCIGDWAADAAHVIEVAAPGREIVLVGSSMGGWIALLLARRLGARVKGLVLVAPAPDFTERLIKPALSAEALAALRTQGAIYPPSAYGEPVPITWRLLEDGARHLLLDGKIALDCPVRILHGFEDADVPWRHSLLLVEALEVADLRATFVKGGDHRLSREADLQALEGLVGEVCGE